VQGHLGFESSSLPSIPFSQHRERLASGGGRAGRRQLAGSSPSPARSWWSAAQMMHVVQCAVEQAFRLPCRYSCRHSPKNVGTDADVAT
jgi:hypothetical protein